MIIAIRDTSGSGRVINETTAALAACSAYAGYDALVLQLTNDSRADISNILYAETDTAASTDVYFSEMGIDALLGEATSNAISKDTFYAVTNGFTKNRRCDVTPPSNNVRFNERLISSTAALRTILTSAKSVYDMIYIPLPATSEALFGSDADSIAELIDMNVILVRQGNVSAVTQRYPNEIYVITGYRPESKHTIRTMARRLGIGRTPIYPLSGPTGYRDAVDEGRLLLYAQTAKCEESDPCSVSSSWFREVTDIITAHNKTKVQLTDVWTVMESYDDADAPITTPVDNSTVPVQSDEQTKLGDSQDITVSSETYADADAIVSAETKDDTEEVSAHNRGFRDAYTKRPTRCRRKS